MNIFLSRLYQRLKFYARVIRGKELYFKVGERIKCEILGNYNAEWCIAPGKLGKGSIVYSFGVGTDISFDQSIIDRYQANVFAFDPTPRCIDWLKKQRLPEAFNFYEYGLAGEDGFITFYPPANPSHVSYSVSSSTAGQAVSLPVFRLQTIMQKLGHNSIDILKMDIEGSEYDVIDDLVSSNLHIQQLLVEFHHRFENINLEKTRKSVELLRNNGYEIFYVSPTGEEYSFIRTNHSK